jgi:hypothetical protein
MDGVERLSRLSVPIVYVEPTPGRIDVLCRGIFRSPYFREDYIVNFQAAASVYPSIKEPYPEVQNCFSLGSTTVPEGTPKIATTSPPKDGFERCLFLTEDGKLGVGPAGAVAGDQVWALLGCSASILLREIIQGQHTVIGPVLVEGTLTGELVLGPLSARGKFGGCSDASMALFLPVISTS